MNPTLTLVPPPAELKPVVKTPNDLPPRWDGNIVEWSPWKLTERGSIIFHQPLSSTACARCGLLEHRVWISRGARAVLPSITLEQIRAATKARKGGKYALVRFYAERCLGCGHDQVYDLDEDELWDLDPSDYTDDGSGRPSAPPPPQAPKPTDHKAGAAKARAQINGDTLW